MNLQTVFNIHFGVKFMSRNKHLPLVCVFVLFIIFCIIIASNLGKRESSQSAATSDISQGITLLKEMESKDSTAVEAVLKAQRQQEILEHREEYLSKLENGEINDWSCLQDYIL